MRASVEPDGTKVADVAALQAVPDEAACRFVDNLHHSDVAGSAYRVLHWMRDALPLVCADNGFIPALGFAPAGFRQWNSGVVAGNECGAAMQDVFEKRRAPFAAQVDLGGRGTRDGQRSQQHDGTESSQ